MSSLYRHSRVFDLLTSGVQNKSVWIFNMCIVGGAEALAYSRLKLENSNIHFSLRYSPIARSYLSLSLFHGPKIALLLPLTEIAPPSDESGTRTVHCPTSALNLEASKAVKPFPHRLQRRQRLRCPAKFLVLILPLVFKPSQSTPRLHSRTASESSDNTVVSPRGHSRPSN